MSYQMSCRWVDRDQQSLTDKLEQEIQRPGDVFLADSDHTHLRKFRRVWVSVAGLTSAAILNSNFFRGHKATVTLDRLTPGGVLFGSFDDEHYGFWMY